MNGFIDLNLFLATFTDGLLVLAAILVLHIGLILPPFFMVVVSLLVPGARQRP